jgi:hypothetical protein
MPATSQLDWLISITATSELSCSKAAWHLLKSFGSGMGVLLRRFLPATMVPYLAAAP